MQSVMTALGFGAPPSQGSTNASSQNQSSIPQTPMFGGIFGGGEPQQYDYKPAPRILSPGRQHARKTEPDSPQARVQRDCKRAEVVEDKFRVPIHQRSTFSRRMKSENLESPAVKLCHPRRKVDQVSNRLYSTTTATHRSKLSPRQLGTLFLFRTNSNHVS